MEDASELHGLQRVLVEERPRLLRFIAARGAGEDAEDVLHDLWQRISSARLEPVSDPISYLFRAADNLVRDRRRSGIQRVRRQEAWHESAVASVVEAVGDRALIARQQLAEAERVLEELGPRVSMTFRRYRIDGLGQSAIARELGVSLSSVEKDLRKAYDAIANLRAKFDEE